jgi:hypothetical protein
MEDDAVDGFAQGMRIRVTFFNGMLKFSISLFQSSRAARMQETNEASTFRCISRLYHGPQGRSEAR